MRVPVEGLVAASMRAQALFTGTYRGPDRHVPGAGPAGPAPGLRQL